MLEAPDEGGQRGGANRARLPREDLGDVLGPHLKFVVGKADDHAPSVEDPAEDLHEFCRGSLLRRFLG